MSFMQRRASRASPVRKPAGSGLGSARPGRDETSTRQRETRPRETRPREASMRATNLSLAREPDYHRRPGQPYPNQSADPSNKERSRTKAGEEEEESDGEPDDFDAKKALLVQMESATLEEADRISDQAQNSIQAIMALGRLLERCKARSVAEAGGATADDGEVTVAEFLEEAVAMMHVELKQLTEVKHLGRVLKTCVSRQQTAISELKRPRHAAKGKGKKAVDPYDAWKEDIADVLDEQVVLRLEIALRHRSYWTLASVFRWWAGRYRAFKKAVLYFSRGIFGKAFNSWKGWLLEKNRLAVLLEKVALRLQNLALHNAFSGYAHRIQLVREAKQRSIRALAYMKNHKLGQAYRRWEEFVEECADMRAKMQRAYTFMARRTERMAWEQWKQEVADQHKRAICATKAIARMAQTVVVKAFNMWLHNLDLLQAQRDRVRGVLLRMLKFHMAQSFGGWRGQVEERKEQAALCLRVVKKAQNIAVAAAWERWAEAVEETHDLKDKAGRVVRRMANVRLAAGFARWEGAAAEARRMRHTASKALARLKNRQLYMGWSGFLAALEARRDLMEKMKRAARTFIHSFTAKTFRTWKASWEDLKAQRRNATRALRFMTNAALSRAFNQWWAVLEAALEIKTKMKKVAARLKNLRAAQAWEGWQAHVEELRDMKARANRALAFWTGNSQKIAWGHWVGAVDARKEEQQLLGRVARRILNLKLSQGFTTWWDNAVTVREQRTRLQRAMAKLLNQKLHAAFAKWKDFLVGATIDHLKDEIKRLQAERCGVLRPLLQLTAVSLDDAELAQATGFEVLRKVGARGRPPKDDVAFLMDAVDQTLGPKRGQVEHGELLQLEQAVMNILLEEMGSLRMAVAGARAVIMRDRNHQREVLARRTAEGDFHLQQKLFQGVNEKQFTAPEPPPDLPACSPLSSWIHWYWQTRHSYKSEHTTQPPDVVGTVAPTREGPAPIPGGGGGGPVPVPGSKKPGVYLYSPRERQPPPGYWTARPAPPSPPPARPASGRSRTSPPSSPGRAAPAEYTNPHQSPWLGPDSAGGAEAAGSPRTPRGAGHAAARSLEVDGTKGPWAHLSVGTSLADKARAGPLQRPISRVHSARAGGRGQAGGAPDGAMSPRPHTPREVHRGLVASPAHARSPSKPAPSPAPTPDPTPFSPLQGRPLRPKSAAPMLTQSLPQGQGGAQPAPPAAGRASSGASHLVGWDTGPEDDGGGGILDSVEAKRDGVPAEALPTIPTMPTRSSVPSPALK